MLLSRISAPQLPDPAQEDIFASSLSVLFTDDTQNSHGTPGHVVIYDSPKYGEIKLDIPQHPDVEEGRKLFAHYLWNAGVVSADAIEVASSDYETSGEVVADGKVNWNKRYWDVKGADVLELGAGTALPSIISALSGAQSVIITDHPSSPALINDTIAKNVLENLKINLLPPTSSNPPPSNAPNPEPLNPTPQPQPQSNTTISISIHGLTWGHSQFTSPTQYGKLSTPQPPQHSFDKIIVADCLWMPSQHVNVVETINTYLRQASTPTTTTAAINKSVPCALLTAGFHTGRRTVARFVEIATGSKTGKEIPVSLDEDNSTDTQDEEAEEEDLEVTEVKGLLRAAEIFEIDVDCNVREWIPERPTENKEETKRWCVCIVLVRREQQL